MEGELLLERVGVRRLGFVFRLLLLLDRLEEVGRDLDALKIVIILNSPHFPDISHYKLYTAFGN